MGAAAMSLKKTKCFKNNYKERKKEKRERQGSVRNRKYKQTQERLFIPSKTRDKEEKKSSNFRDSNTIADRRTLQYLGNVKEERRIGEKVKKCGESWISRIECTRYYIMWSIEGWKS